MIRKKRKNKIDAQQNLDSSYDERVSKHLQENEDRLKEIFHYPQNHGLVVRKLYISALNKEGMVVYLKATVTVQTVEKHIIESLLTSSKDQPEPDEDLDQDIASYMLKQVLTTTNGIITDSFTKIVNRVINGSTIVFIDGSPNAIVIETSGFVTRSIEKPTNENYVKGPEESFVESVYSNISLIRKQIRDPELVCEVVTIGERSPQQVSIVYINNLANPEIVQQVKSRIMEIKSDTVLNLSILEQFIEDRPYSLISSTLNTVRPDRTCSLLLEGHVALLMENSPSAIIVPITFWTLFHTGEDQYLRWSDGNFLRLIRLFAVFIALLTPSIYIAVVSFHVEMLPTDLMLAIAATREVVPFPSFVEVLFMEVTFEILREAGVRIPAVIGSTIGIVGALILGQAAVDANIVSPILVIVVAITGLSSFAIPEISFNFAVRILRFIVLLISAFIGFFGIALFLAFLAAYLVSIKSFGVPFVSPMAPHMRSSKDLIIRPTIWNQLLRPSNLYPQDLQRMSEPKGKK